MKKYNELLIIFLNILTGSEFQTHYNFWTTTRTYSLNAKAAHYITYSISYIHNQSSPSDFLYSLGSNKVSTIHPSTHPFPDPLMPKRVARKTAGIGFCTPKRRLG